ncbi:hypothetical protein OAK15_02435 [Verrucomicrobia bacterium]|nr:hypothetical protein [Verrucomicrobiota bacterium]
MAKGICRSLGHCGSCTGNAALGQASRRFAFRWAKPSRRVCGRWLAI